MPRPDASWRKNNKREWVRWLEEYGAAKFYDAFVRNAQYAQSKCVHCGQKIYLDIVEGGGVPDWGSELGSRSGGLDYGCDSSPDTTDDGVGGHEPVKL